MLLPEEELYRELIGFESARQEIGITFKLDSSFPYDMLEVIRNADYRISSAPTKKLGKDLLVVEREGCERIFIDPALGFAIVRRERNWNAGLPLRVVIDNSNFRMLDSKLWLPTKSHIQYFGKPDSSPGKVIIEADLSVEHISLTSPDALFQIAPNPGMEVADVLHRKVLPIPPMNGRSLSEALDSASTSKPARAGDGIGNFWRCLLVIVNLVVIAILALLYTVRSIRHKRLGE